MSSSRRSALSGFCESTLAMSDDYYDATPRPHTQDGFCQCCLAFGIEVGVGLVQHNQERIPIESTCQRYSLALPCGKRLCLFPEFGLITVRQA